MRLFSDAASAVADPFLRRAFELAEHGRGTTSPNPLVGCVVVRDGEVVGEGWHEFAGGPHAEVNALGAAGERARGATAYVTLEPCDHTGRTGPCTLALRRGGVAAVVIGMRDPNPDVDGGGAEALQAAGVRVRFAEDPAPFEEQNEAWLKLVRTGVPWVDAKVALTLDGKLALAPGVRSALTGSGGAEVTRRLRAAADAVLVGASTAETDDPALTVRDSGGTLAAYQPLRVVLARSRAPRSDLRVFTDGAAPAIVLAPHGVETGDVAAVRYDAGEGTAGALLALGAEGVARVLVEPGARLFESLWAADAIDELVVVTAGGIGGAAAVPLFASAPAGSSLGRLEARMRAAEAGVMGEDAVTVWRRGERE